MKKENEYRRAKMIDEDIAKQQGKTKTWWKKKLLKDIPADYFIPTNCSLITGVSYQELWEEMG